MQKEESINNRVKLYPDGKYRWIYEVPMLKNPSIIIDVFKVVGISLGIVWLFMVLLSVYDGDFSLESLLDTSMVFVGLMLVFAVIVFLAYVILAWHYGWKYVVLFTMDKSEIVHQQMPYQVKKAQVLGALAAMIGGAAGNLGMVGTGVLAASRTTSTSTLVRVNRLIPVRRMNLIKVNQKLHKNRIYVPDEDFDFVYDFLCQQCINAKD
jgi:hypothetical protein